MDQRVLWDPRAYPEGMPMPDLIEEMFEEPPHREEYYPGSKRKRREAPEPIEGDPWREEYTTKMVGGQERRFYTIGALASAVNASVETVRHWIKTGKIPQAPYRLSTSIVAGKKHPGRRLYTEPMIDAAVASFRKRGLLDASRIEWKNHPDLTLEIHEAWTRIHNQETGK